MAVMPCGDSGEGGLVTELAADPVATGVARWASEHGLAPSVVTGSGAGLALVAAVWFSSPLPLARTAAATALLTSFAASRAGGMLAAPVQAAAPAAGWLMAGCWALSEWMVYAGLAVRAGPGVAGVWQLAAAAMLLLAIRQMTDLCYACVAEQAHGRPGHPRPAWLRRAGRSLVLPSGERVVLVAVTGAVWGPWVTFPALLGWGTLALGCVLVPRIAAARGTAAGAVAGRGASSAGLAGDEGAGSGQIAACRDDGRLSRWLGGLVKGRLPPLPPVITGMIVTSTLAALGFGNLMGILVLTPAEAMLLAGFGSGHPHDGPLDWLVPALLQAGEYLFLAGLAFTRLVPPPLTFALLAAVALRHLDIACRARYRVIWPVPGRSGHRVARPVPGRSGYRVARPVPGRSGYRVARPVPGRRPGPAGSAFAVYAGSATTRTGRPASLALGADWAGLGWELRMLTLGLAGALGVMTFACVVLAGYLWCRLGWDFLTGWPAARRAGG